MQTLAILLIQPLARRAKPGGPSNQGRRETLDERVVLSRGVLQLRAREGDLLFDGGEVVSERTEVRVRGQRRR